MFWRDQTIRKVQEQFSGIAFAFSGDCLRWAEEVSRVPHTSLELFAPLGVVSACFNRYWASKNNTERRSKALVECIRDMPGAWAQKNTHIMQASGVPPAVADRINQAQIEKYLFSGIQNYNNALEADDAWIGSHLRQGKKPTIPFRNTAQALAKNYFQEDRFQPDNSSAWIYLGMPIAILFTQVISFNE